MMNKFLKNKYVRKTAYTFLTLAALDFGIHLASYLSPHWTEKIQSRDHASKIIEQEKQKLGLEAKVYFEFANGEYNHFTKSFATVSKTNDGYNIKFYGDGKDRGTVRHELWHIWVGDVDRWYKSIGKFENHLAKQKLGIDPPIFGNADLNDTSFVKIRGPLGEFDISYRLEEQRAILYEVLGLKF